jgi:putative transposase
VAHLFLAKEGLMPSYQPQQSGLPRFQLVLSSFLQHEGLPFAEVLPEERIQQVFQEADATFAHDEDGIYTPAVTLWAFLSQVLFKGEMRSCLAAVARVIVLCVALGRKPCSDNSGAYCRARAKLPVPVIQRLALDLADECEDKLPPGWLWKDRHVHLVDGSTLTMPDTEENQAEYPQMKSQEPGLGFPIARVVVLLSLATAMLQGMAMGPYTGKETGESALLRELFGRLRPGSVVLADRHYGSYFMVALLMEMGIDVVMRQHQRRDTDFRRGRRLGAGDHIVTWIRPQRPDWMDQETYERMPETLTVREVHVEVHQPGFRVESLVVVTTLTDAESYTQDDIGELYHQRWLVELDIRALKITLGIDVLRCQTPEMVRREIWVALLAYNLIRRAMLQAALVSESDLSPRQLSFTAAMQKIAASWGTLAVCADSVLIIFIDVHLQHIGNNEIGDRPDRVEPRGIKHRPKNHKLLTKPREQARAELLARPEQ